MPSDKLPRALAYIDRLELPQAHSMAPAAESAPVDFDALNTQAAVVGSEVVSFAQGVSAGARDEISQKLVGRAVGSVAAVEI